MSKIYFVTYLAMITIIYAVFTEIGGIWQYAAFLCFLIMAIMILMLALELYDWISSKVKPANEKEKSQ